MCTRVLPCFEFVEYQNASVRNKIIIIIIQVAIIKCKVREKEEVVGLTEEEEVCNSGIGDKNVSRLTVLYQ